MTVAVVDRLEIVEIEIADSQQFVVPARLRQPLLQAVGEQGAIRQAGERIEKGQALQLAPGFLVAGDVGEDRDIVRNHAGRIAQGADGQPFGVEFAGFLAVPDVALPVAGGGQRAPHLDVVGAVLHIRLEQAGAAPDHFVARISGQCGEGRIDIDDAAGAIGDRHAFPRMGKNPGMQIRIGK